MEQSYEKEIILSYDCPVQAHSIYMNVAEGYIATAKTPFAPGLLYFPILLSNFSTSRSANYTGVTEATS